jgi:4-hydroxy-2-oxoheptanedioate aldolase
MRRIVATCHKHKVVVGNPHVTAKNHKKLMEEGYRFLMAAPTKSYGVVGLAQQAATSY